MIEPTDEMIRAFDLAMTDVCLEEDETRRGLAAVLALVERDYAVLPKNWVVESEAVHLINDEDGVTRCCGRTLFELPHGERCTHRPSLRTCRGPS